MNNHVHWCLSSMVNFSEPFVSFIFDCLQSIESNQIIKLFTHPNMIEGLSLILQDRRLGCWVKLSDKVRSHRWLQRTEKTKDGQEWSRRPWWIDWCVLCILMPFDRHIKRNDRLIIHVTPHTQFESTQHNTTRHNETPSSTEQTGYWRSDAAVRFVERPNDCHLMQHSARLDVSQTRLLSNNDGSWLLLLNILLQCCDASTKWCWSRPIVAIIKIVDVSPWSNNNIKNEYTNEQNLLWNVWHSNNH